MSEYEYTIALALSDYAIKAAAKVENEISRMWVKRKEQNW
jgi:hypothetical protein